MYFFSPWYGKWATSSKAIVWLLLGRQGEGRELFLYLLIFNCLLLKVILMPKWHYLRGRVFWFPLLTLHRDDCALCLSKHKHLSPWTQNYLPTQVFSDLNVQSITLGILQILIQYVWVVPEIQPFYCSEWYPCMHGPQLNCKVNSEFAIQFAIRKTSQGRLFKKKEKRYF